MIKSSEFNLLSNGQPSGKPTGSDGSAEISTVNSETEEVNWLTFEGVEAPPGSPSWLPDGSKIIFTTYREGDWEAYMMNADGSDQKNPGRFIIHTVLSFFTYALAPFSIYLTGVGFKKLVNLKRFSDFQHFLA